jgi:hypothetical protein
MTYILLGIAIALVLFLVWCCCRAASKSDERDGKEVNE